MSDIIPYLEEMNRRCASGAPMRIEPKNARKSRKRSVGRCHRAHGKPLRGIDGVKYPVGTMHGMPKGGEGLRFNYVSFRDDNIRVDHKWTDGQQRYSVTRDRDYTPSDPQREYDEVVARYTNPDGTRKPGWMKAPNGRPTNLAERQWVQVRTPAFRAWFGDWEGDPANASKVVDENGEPLVVYHATDNAFTVFDRSRLGENTDYNAYDEAAKRMSRLGFWFNESDLRKRTNTKLSVSAYVDIKNPYETTFDELWNAMSETSHEEFIEDLNREGYDGITLEDAEFGGKSFVLLEPTQIKSATDNTGEFGPGADIRYSVVRGEVVNNRIAPAYANALTFKSASEQDAESVRANPRLREEVEAALNTDRERGDVLKGGRRIDICEAPALFREIGIPDGTVYTKAHTLRKIFQNHGLTAGQIASTPELIANPAAVLDDNGEGYIFLTDALAPDRNGRMAPVMVYLRPDGDGNYIASEYSRTEDAESKYINLTNAGGLLYADKDKVARLPLRGEALSSLSTFNAGDRAEASGDESPSESARIVPQTGVAEQGGVTRLRVFRDENAPATSVTDLTTAFLAQRILAGKDPTVDDARKFLDGFGLSRTLDAGAALRAAREIAETNRERLKGEVERANPEVIGTLARANLSREMQSAMDSLVTGAARAVDQEVGMRLKDAVAARDRRALMAAKGFTAAEMMARLPVSLSEAVLSVAELERTPEERARREEELKKREEERAKESEGALAADADGYIPAMDEVEPTDEQKRRVAELLDRAKFASERTAATIIYKVEASRFLPRRERVWAVDGAIVSEVAADGENVTSIGFWPIGGDGPV